jgi:hypothetical protein
LRLKSLLLLFPVIVFIQTLHTDAILNINQPIRSLIVSNEQMKSAIISAAEEQKWIVTPDGDGQLSAAYQKSDYVAKIAIKYAPTFYTINYADSTRMRYDGKSIHPTYNKLIKALQANIIRNLKAGDFTMQTDATSLTTSALPVQQEDDIRTKLVNVKKLYDDGLITQEEYNSKRKALIEAY